MSIETFEKLKKMLCKELDELVEKGDLKAGSLDAIDKLTHSIKSLVTIMAMEDAGYSNDYGYSGAGRDRMGRYSYGGSYNYRDGDIGYSGRRYMNDDFSARRYSRDEGVSYLSDEIEKLMDKAKTQEERDVLQKAHKTLKQMM